MQSKILLCALLMLSLAAKSNDGMTVWLETSLKRIFPQSPAGTAREPELALKQVLKR